MPLHAAGDLLVGEAAVDVDGHASVKLHRVRVGPHHPRVASRGEDWASQLVAELRAQYLHTRSLIITTLH